MSKIKSENIEEIFVHTESRKVGDKNNVVSFESSDTSRVNENSIIQENIDLQKSILYQYDVP